MRRRDCARPVGCQRSGRSGRAVGGNWADPGIGHDLVPERRGLRVVFLGCQIVEQPIITKAVNQQQTDMLIGF